MWTWKAWCWRIENVLGEYLGTVRRMLDRWKICEVGLISGNRKDTYNHKMFEEYYL